MLTVSLHMDHGAWGPTHPQTGAVEEIGSGPGRGFNINLPLPFGTGDAGYERAMREVVVPVVRQYEPDLVIGAIGQDASQFDPNGRQTVTMRGFHRLGAILRELADEVAGGRLALVQEGGYAVSYAAFCLHATLAGVLGEPVGMSDPLAFLPDHAAGVDRVIARARDALGSHWNV